jgi:hypothetical protein
MLDIRRCVWGYRGYRPLWCSWKELGLTSRRRAVDGPSKGDSSRGAILIPFEEFTRFIIIGSFLKLLDLITPHLLQCRQALL